MPFLVLIISFFWFIRTMKIVLFWIYLWQLKEYHIGRFMDHFRTYKGKKIFLNYLWFLKFVLLALLFLHFYLAFYILLLTYFAESFVFGFNVAKKNALLPKFTLKTVFLSIVALSDVIGYFYFLNIYIQTSFWFIVALLAYDIFVPLIVSLIVLMFQPFFVIARNRILKKAKEKILMFNNLTVIGITGSYGKTSTKEFLTTILSSKFKVLSTPKHKNSEIGIAQTILSDLKQDHQIFIVEMGAYNKGGISLLCDMVKPKIGIVTGVNEQHLSTFGTFENLLCAEGGRELVNNLPDNGLIVVNGDNAHCLDLYKKIYKSKGEDFRKKVYTLKRETIDSDIWTEDITVEKNYISFIASLPTDNKGRAKEMAHFTVNILGRQNVQNILGAIIIAKEMGMSLEEISEACKNIKTEQAGITIKNGLYGINVVDSSYSSNPDGVIADLDYLSVFNGKKVIVMPCLIELGNKSAEIHRQIGKKIAKVCDLAIITTKDKFEEIKSVTALTANPPRIVFSEKPKEIFQLITTFCKEGDTVLLEGRVPSELIKLLSGK